MKMNFISKEKGMGSTKKEEIKMIRQLQQAQLLLTLIAEVSKTKINMYTNLTETMWEKTEETPNIKKQLFN